MSQDAKPNQTAAIEQLRGLLEGVSCDYSINEEETFAVQKWLEQHANLLNRSPFDGLARLLTRVMADGRIDEAEHEELLDWFASFADEKAPGVVTQTEALQRLAGAIRGLLADGVVTPEETESFRDWLRDYERFRRLWAFDEVWRNLPAAVNETDPLYNGLLVASLKSVVDLLDDRTPKTSASAGDDTFHFDSPADIRFAGRSFCFSGEFGRFSRHSLPDLVLGLGGVAKSGVSRKLDYLVVGSLGSEAWAYSGYGTKVAAVLKNRAAGAATMIVCEEDFAAALATAGAAPSARPSANCVAPRKRPFAHGGLYETGFSFGWDELRYAVLDVETTGFHPDRDRIVEIALVELDSHGEVVDEMSSLVQPRRKVAASEIHGITDEHLSDAPTFAQIIGHVLRRLSGRVVVGHNADFDGAFLWSECFAAGVELPLMPALCTVKLTRSIDPRAGSYKLDACCRRLGLELEDHHSALADCRGTALLLKEWIRHGRAARACGPRFPVNLPKLPEVESTIAPLPRW
ncbi:MAG TPA: hypothetical protein DFS52_25560 [Myxococcales bacterium]|nr:hypothetical protein [Myxococcales bacterium]